MKENCILASLLEQMSLANQDTWFIFVEARRKPLKKAIKTLKLMRFEETNDQRQQTVFNLTLICFVFEKLCRGFQWVLAKTYIGKEKILFVVKKTAYRRRLNFANCLVRWYKLILKSILKNLTPSPLFPAGALSLLNSR